MTNGQILEKFEDATLLPFTHRLHINVAWLYLRRDDWDAGYANIQQGIQHFADVHDVSDKYHETITRFWAHLIYHAIVQSPDVDDFDQFLRQYPMLIEKNTLTEHYSPKLLSDPASRKTWVEPDLRALPALN